MMFDKNCLLMLFMLFKRFEFRNNLENQDWLPRYERLLKIFQPVELLLSKIDP